MDLSMNALTESCKDKTKSNFCKQLLLASFQQGQPMAFIKPLLKLQMRTMVSLLLHSNAQKVEKLTLIYLNWNWNTIQILLERRSTWFWVFVMLFMRMSILTLNSWDGWENQGTACTPVTGLPIQECIQHNLLLMARRLNQNMIKLLKMIWVQANLKAKALNVSIFSTIPTWGRISILHLWARSMMEWMMSWSYQWKRQSETCSTSC